MKKFSELTFADDFMFGKVLEDKEICRELLERLLKIKIEKLSFPKLQPVLNPCYDAKGVRFDVFAADENRNFDIEIQVARKEDLPLRTRYYQSLMDTDTLLKGSDYVDLKQSYVIFICQFDPIGAGLPVYTVHSKIDENDEIFDDKSVKVLYNTTAYAAEKDKSIRAFLEYVSTQKATDDWTARLEQRVAEIRATQSARSDYMTYQMHIKEWVREGRAEGRLEGIAIGERRGEKRGVAIGEKRGAHDKAVQTARAFLALGVATPEQIAQATGLPLAEIQSLANASPTR